MTHAKEIAMSVNNDRQIALVTGAASGIGRAIARLLHDRGWFVACLDRDACGMAALAGELGDGNGLFLTVDVADRTALSAAVNQIASVSGGRLDMLVNNAGIDAKGAFAEMEWDRIVAVVNVNLVAGMSLIHLAYPMLRATSGSLCLSTASASAIFGTAGMAVYSATKHAIKGLTEALSVEFAADGVRVADMLPGIIDTGILDPAVKAMLPTEGPLRVIDPADVAMLALTAYHSTGLHYYIPQELADYDVDVTTNPEAARDRRIAGSPM